MKQGKMWGMGPGGQEQFVPETLASAVYMEEGGKTLKQAVVDGELGGGPPGPTGPAGPAASCVALNVPGLLFAGNKDGQVTGGTVVAKVLAITGTSKVTPVVGAPTGLPTGLTAAVGAAVNNEIPITFTIAANATLGGAGQQQGVISIPITSPVATTLMLAWSKTNVGATGGQGIQGPPGADGHTPTLAEIGAAPASHTHTKANITDFAHTHPLGELSGVTPAAIGASVTGHTHTKANITDFPASLPANGGNAATVGGYAPNTAAATNTLVLRDANGYGYFTYVNSNRGDETSGAASYIYDTGDGWMRKKNIQNVKRELIGRGTAAPSGGSSGDVYIKHA